MLYRVGGHHRDRNYHLRLDRQQGHMWIAVNETNCIVTRYELLIETWVFVVNTGINHSDDDTVSRYAEVPCTWIQC